MTKTPEERIASLEMSFISMGEGIARVEKTLEKLDGSVTSLVDKLDARYPTKESVDLRLQELRNEYESLKLRVTEVEKNIDKLTAWRNWLTGAYVVLVGVAVILFEYGRQWVIGGTIH